jgi:hypothetical protein
VSHRLRAGETKMKKFLCAIWLFIVLPAVADSPTTAGTYPSGGEHTIKLAGELYQVLEAKDQKHVNRGDSHYSQPISLQSLDKPVITPIESSDENKRLNQVSVSSGFLNLINHIAHAKAIDKFQPGYYDKYLANLARETVEGGLPKPPNMVEARLWKDDIMNEQGSYFNQMISMLVAINLSHHYLGHFAKYQKDLAAGTLTPINGLLTPGEWQASVRAGAKDAFDCGYTGEGIKALMDGIDKMPRRPQWTFYFFPEHADLKKLAKELTHYEELYFKGGLH